MTIGADAMDCQYAVSYQYSYKNRFVSRGWFPTQKTVGVPGLGSEAIGFDNGSFQIVFSFDRSHSESSICPAWRAQFVGVPWNCVSVAVRSAPRSCSDSTIARCPNQAA